MIVRELITLVGFKLDKAAMRRASNAASRLGSKMQKIGRGLSMALTLPITALGVSMLKIAGDFEASMNRVQVLTNATGEEFDKLRQQARDLGATTAFSAKEAADGMGFLAQAGFEVNEIFQAMPATLNLAGAAKQDLATTADQLSNIMQGFGLEASEAGHASDVLALAASSSNTNLSQLAEAMKFAAPGAKALGVTMEDTAAIIGFMGNAGIQASMAGTGLRMALLRLLKPTGEAQEALDELSITTFKYGRDGSKSIRNIVDILQDLQDAKASPLQLTTIFGIRAFTGMTAVLDQGIDSLKEFIRVLTFDAAATALRQQEAQMRGLNGAILALKSAYGELAIAVGDAGLLDNTTKFTKKITNLIRELAKTNPEKLAFFTKFATFAAALPVATFAIGKLSSAVGLMMGTTGAIAFATLVAGLVAVTAAATLIADPNVSGVPVNEMIPLVTVPQVWQVGRQSIQQSVAQGALRLGQGAYLPPITINNETTINLSGHGSITSEEGFEATERAMREAMNSTVSQIQRNFLRR